MDKIKIVALGGLDEAGRDCYVIEINDDLFVLDAGSSLPDKNIPGVDFILPNYDYIIQNKHRLKAYILSHGHDEQIAAIKYFYSLAPAPIYCSESTKITLLGQGEIHHIKNEYEFITIDKSCNLTIAGHKIAFFQTAHNSAFSFGVSFSTDRGNIVYTGDFIIDWSVKDKQFLFDIEAISGLSNQKTLLLMAESKFASKSGYCAPNHRVTPLIEKYFKENQKRIFINSFWQNSFRIYEICELCKKYHKKIYFYNDYTSKIMSIVKKGLPDLYGPNDVLSKEDLLRIRKQDVVIILLGHGAEIYNEMNKLSMGENDDKRLSLEEDDVFINAALPTPALEVQATRSIDNLYRTKCEVVWLTNKVLYTMHAREEDLKFFLSLLKPQYYLPIRGSFINIMDNAKLALSMGIGLNHMNVFVLDNGMQLVFDDKIKPTIIPNNITNIPVTPALVDGTGVYTLGPDLIEERKKLGVDGVVVVASTISKKERKIIAGPDCQMRGFVYVKEAEPLLKSVSNIYIEEVTNALNKPEYPDFANVKEVIIDRVRKYIKRDNGRDPMILPIFVEID